MGSHKIKTWIGVVKRPEDQAGFAVSTHMLAMFEKFIAEEFYD